VPEIEEKLIKLAQAAAGDEEITGTLGPALRPLPQPEDDDDVEQDDAGIQGVETEDLHLKSIRPIYSPFKPRFEEKVNMTGC
jgi:hypothetical protein